MVKGVTGLSPHPPGKEVIPRRIIFLGTALVILFSVLTPLNDLYLRNTPLAGNLLPTHSVLTLLFLSVVLNPLLHRWMPHYAFQAKELGALWALLVIPSGIPMAGFWRYILPQISGLTYRASSANRWDTLLLPYAPDWLIVTDKVAARGFYEGGSPSIPWDAWMTPLLNFWVPFGVALLFGVFCLATLLRRQWTEREHFTFPLVQVPLELIRRSKGESFPTLFRHRPFWFGFLASVGFHTLSGLKLYFPAVPAPRRIRRLGEYLYGFPWDSIRWTFLNIYPAGIGLTYLLTTEVAFSLWFFFILERLQQVLFTLMGRQAFGMSATDFVQYQQLGAIFGLFFVVLYGAKEHWRQVWGVAVGKRKGDEEEPLPYPVAFWGLWVISAFLIWWQIRGGVSPLLAASFIVMAFGFYVAAGWIASNGGLLMVQMRILPHDPIWATLGSRRFSPRDIIVSFLLQKAFTYDLRETLMPSLLNAFKLADEVGIRRRCVGLWGMVLIALAIPVSLVTWLKLCYNVGGITMEGSTFNWHVIHPFLLMAQAIDPGLQPNVVRGAGLLLGSFLFVGCFLLRRWLVWFPLHPMGLIVCRGWAMENLWLMVVLGWLLKVVILRYGGLVGYQGLRPLFLGLVLGDLTMAGFFGFIGAFTGRGYVVLP